MRVLVIATAGAGHIYPVVPIAEALRAAGHDLLWAVPPDAVGTIASFGMRAQPAGMNQIASLEELQGVEVFGADTSAATARRAELLRRLANTASRDNRPLVWPLWFVGAQGAAMLADLGPIADSWRPDVVIHEPNAVAAAPLAARRGLPHVAVGYGGFVPQAVFDAADDELRSLWQAEELGVRPSAGLYDHLYLHPLPDSFGPPPPAPTVHPMRPVGFDGAAPTEEPPEWVAPLGKSRPCVYVTYGTVEAVATQAPFQAVFDAFERLDVDAVWTVGRRVNIKSLPTSPPNVHVSGYVPQRFLLERSSLVVSHAGSGTFVGALRYGIPQVCMPILAENFDNADLVTAAGCGLSLDSHQVNSPSIFEAVTRLLDDPVFTSSARTVAAQIRLMPEPKDLVGRITQCAL